MFMIIGILLATGVAMYVWTETIMKHGAEPKADGTNEYAIILGAKVREEGIPSLALQYRIVAAEEYLLKYPHVKVILSGGQGDDEPVSEADMMYTYLLEAGIEKERLIREDASTSTYENLLFSKRLLPQNTSKVTIISSDFHLARAQFIAQYLNLDVDVVEAKTPRVVERKLRNRERFALIKAVIVGR